jgi:hypothetical protein
MARTYTNSALTNSALPMVAGAEPRTRASGLVLVYAFIISLVLPVEASFFIGPLRLTPYRIVLIFAVVPCILRMLNGQAGGFKWVDALMFLHVMWASIALFFAHGLKSWEISGIYFIEVLTPYLLARCYVRTVEQFDAVVRFLFWIILGLLFITAFESLTGNFLRGPVVIADPRWGLHRAYGPFEHPILYGVFTASMFGITYFAMKGRTSVFRQRVAAGVIILATMFSLSAGPLVAILAQVLLMAWNRAMERFKYRWSLLIGAFAASWVIVDLISSRTPLHVFISYFTFNASTAYQRLLIWEYGTMAVGLNPFFGIGHHDWQRPSWLPASIDNFWLVEAVRFGVPAAVLLIAAVVLMCVHVARAPAPNPASANCRAGWLISIVGLAIAACTVHLWNATFTFFMFLLGCGGWIAWPEKKAAQPAPYRRHRPMTRRAAFSQR